MRVYSRDARTNLSPESSARTSYGAWELTSSKDPLLAGSMVGAIEPTDEEESAELSEERLMRDHISMVAINGREKAKDV
jgi:hypothetical protein